MTNSVKLISLIYGENWHIFKPRNVNAEDSTYAYEILRQHNVYFGPFPMSIRTPADRARLSPLVAVVQSVQGHKPFKMASSREIAKEDRAFICKLMRRDPRDRPSAEELLQDPWLEECIADAGSVVSEGIAALGASIPLPPVAVLEGSL